MPCRSPPQRPWRRPWPISLVAALFVPPSFVLVFVFVLEAAPFTSPRRGEVKPERQRRLRVRGSLHTLGLAAAPHPHRIWRCDPTSPLRGEVTRGAAG